MMPFSSHLACHNWQLPMYNVRLLPFFSFHVLEGLLWRSSYERDIGCLGFEGDKAKTELSEKVKT